MNFDGFYDSLERVSLRKSEKKLCSPQLDSIPKIQRYAFYLCLWRNHVIIKMYKSHHGIDVYFDSRFLCGFPATRAEKT